MPPATPSEPIFRYAEREPHPSLRRWVSRYWGFEVRSDATGAPQHHVPPDGCTSLVLVPGPRPAVLLSGPWVSGMVVPVVPGARYYGVRFHPDSAGQVLGLDPQTLRERSQPGISLLGAWARDLLPEPGASVDFEAAAGLIERTLLPLCPQWPEPDRLARSAVVAIAGMGGDCGIESLAAELRVSPRTLHRRFRRATGLAPKEFARIVRLRHATVAALSPRARGWSALALDHGYSDQAHLAREFSALTGLTPEQLLARLRRTAHDNVAP